MPDYRHLAARGTRAALATPHHAATQAGLEAIADGGTAVDAALSAAAVLCVVYPHNCSVGGDLFALVRRPDGRVIEVNGSGSAARGASREDIARKGGSMPTKGPDTITVPGAVAGWDALHGQFGRRPWTAALLAAADVARAGFPVPPSLADALLDQYRELAGDAGMSATFQPEGRQLRAGELIRQPALAATLETLAEKGAEDLYSGGLARQLAAGLDALGSRLTIEDFAAHATTLGAPLERRWRDRRVVTAKPNSQGFVLLQILALIELLEVDPDPLGESTAALARIYAAAAEERDRFLGDPRTMQVPVEELLSSARLARMARLVKAGGADGTPDQTAGTSSSRARSGDTVAVVAADAEGWAISLIQSVFSSFGSGLLEPSTGIVLHNRGASFSLDPASPNALAPGKRPAHTLMPLLVSDNAGLTVIGGTMGGYGQPQIHAGLVGGLLAGSTPVEELLQRPRWLVGETDAGQRSDVLLVEREVPDSSRRALAGCGLPIHDVGHDSEEVGHAQYIVRDRDGLFLALSDPRADGCSAAL